MHKTGCSGFSITRLVRRAFLFFALASIFLLVSDTASASATNPGDEWVFGADSPVTVTHPAGQQQPDISGNIAVWSDSRPGGGAGNPARIFFKDLTNSDAEVPLVLLPGNGQSTDSQTQPAISGNLVVWSQGFPSQIHYMFLGEGCPGTAGCDQTLSLTGARPVSLAVSGHRIVWGDQRAGYWQDDIYMYDLDNPSLGEQPVSTASSTQQFPAIDGDWVVWVDNRGGTYVFGNPTRNDIYARNLVTGEERPLTTDYQSALEQSPRISGNRVVWNINSGYNATTGGIVLYDLSSRQTQTIFDDRGTDCDPDIEGDKIVWVHQPTPGSYEVRLHDLATGINQTVSSGSIPFHRPAVSSGHIVWQDSRDGAAAIYENKLGERAQALADTYKPVVRTAFEENFLPMTVEQFLAAPLTVLKKKNDSNFTPILNPTVSDLATRADIPDLYLDLRGSSILAGGGNPSRSIYNPYIISTYFLPYVELRNQRYAIYSRVVSGTPGSAHTAIQYWILYYANDHPELFHEGDWEIVQVELDDQLQPYRAVYSQHDHPKWRHWDAVEKYGQYQPVVYVAQGSHANYFNSSDRHYVKWPVVWDVALGDGISLNDENNISIPVKVLPEVNQVAVGSEFEWLKYIGQWGEYTNAYVEVPFHEDLPGLRDGADNPPVQDPWRNPLNWSNSQCDGCQDQTGDSTDLQETALSPVDIHIYDSQGRHVGKNASGGIDKQIPGSEYLEYPDLHRKTIIIHGADINAGYRTEAVGNGSGPCELILTAPDHPGGSVDTLDYQAIQVTPSTKLTANLDSSKDYVLNVDANGDGTSVTQKPPDVITTKTVDFTPPSEVTDLALAGSDSGSATLSFSAPGDDGNQGTATAYDLRYSNSAITDQYWKDAIPASGLSAPLPAGSTQTVTVDDLTPGTTYNFALKTMDDVGLYSTLSNVVSVYIPITTTTTGSAAATASNIASIDVSVPYANDDNENGAALVEYKLSGDAAWSEYGTVPHPVTTATIQGLSNNSSYDVYVTYQDPDGVNGTTDHLISGIQLPTPPAATNVQPSGTVFGETATIRADLSAGFGINPAAVLVTLDGNLIPGCSATAAAFNCLVSGLTFGLHTIGGTIADNTGNTAPISGSFNIGDNTAPAITEVLPIGTVYGGATDIRVNYTDPGIASGIDMNSVLVNLDGNPLPGCTASESSVTCPASGVSFGDHIISGSVSDNSGNTTPINGAFKMIEWNEAQVLYQSGLIPSQPSLYQLSDGRTLLVFAEQFPNSLKFRVSDDGINWQIPAGSTGTIPYATGVQPSVTQLPSGIIVVSYAEYYRNPLNGAYSWVVRVTCSSDLINWSWPTFAGGSNSLAPSIATLDNGQVMLTYTREGANTNLYGISGSFNGSYWSWGNSTLVYGGALYDSKPSVINMGNNELLCAFFSGSNWSADRNTWLSRDIYAVRSLDGGHTWLNQTPVTVYQGTGSADFWPSLLQLSNGKIICAFTTSEEGSVNQLNIKMVSSTDRGYSWGSEETISTATHSETWPALAQRPDGSVICVWDSDPGQASSLYYLYSSRLVTP